MEITLGLFKVVFDTGKYYALGHEEYWTLEEAIKEAKANITEFNAGEIASEPYCIVQVKHIIPPSWLSKKEKGEP